MQLTDSKQMQIKAVEQWVRTLPLTAKRGQVVDCNGNTLAISNTSYDVYLRAKEIGANAVFYGHTHVADITKQEGLKNRIKIKLAGIITVFNKKLLEEEKRKKNENKKTSKFSKILKRKETIYKLLDEGYIDRIGLNNSLFLSNIFFIKLQVILSSSIIIIVFFPLS